MDIKLSLKSPEDQGYEIWCRPGLRHFLKEHIERLTADRKDGFWIVDRAVFELWEKDIDVSGDRLIQWEAVEAKKNLSSVERLARELVRRGADRSSLLVALGGGVTGDTVAFLASIYMRGIPVVQVPTTLVAQVDSSVGGKTGVDLPEGKNLIGTFHHPLWVAIDPEFLTTLPPQTFSQGMAEVIKTAWIGDPFLMEMLEKEAASIKAGNVILLQDVIQRCVAVKARIVMADERESGERRKLNLGHTFGHAVEKVSGYKVFHGDAVAMGLVCALKVGVYLKLTSRKWLEKTVDLLDIYALPSQVQPDLNYDVLLEALYADKKKSGKTLTFVIPREPGDVTFFETSDVSILKEIFRVIME